MKVEIFIPCFNEEKNIPLLVSSWSEVIDNAEGYDIFVTFIDNGSIDLTKNELRRSVKASKNYKLRILIKDNNDGYGSGIMFGVNESSADLVGWAHADLQFDPSQIVENLNNITKNLDKDEEILIVGERLYRSLVDVIFTKGMSLTVWLFTRIYIRDINSQPKIFSNSLLKKLYILPSDFNLDLHIFLKARKLSYRIIRIKLSFKDRVFESAKGGGTIYGKIKLTYSVLKYLFAKSFDD